MRILRVYFNGRDARATFSNSITTRLNRCSGKARLMDSAARYRSFRNARRQIDDFPGRAVAQQRRHERGVQQVTAPLSLDSTEDRHSKQGQVTNDVQNLDERIHRKNEDRFRLACRVWSRQSRYQANLPESDSLYAAPRRLR